MNRLIIAVLTATFLTAANPAAAADCTDTGKRRAMARGSAAASSWVQACQNPQPVAAPAEAPKKKVRKAAPKRAPASNGTSKALDDLDLRLKTVEEVVLKPEETPWQPSGWEVLFLIVLGLVANRVIGYLWERKRNEWKSNGQRINELTEENEVLSAALAAMGERLIALETVQTPSAPPTPPTPPTGPKTASGNPDPASAAADTALATSATLPKSPLLSRELS